MFISFPAVRSLTLLSLTHPLLSVASTAWMSAVQRKEPVASARFLAAQLHEMWSWPAAVRVGRQLAPMESFHKVRQAPLNGPRRSTAERRMPGSQA
jgi:hypothetical protein